MKQQMILLAIMFVLFVCCDLLQAQWSTDPTVNNPISTLSGPQYNPIAVSDGEEGTIMIWIDERSGQNIDVYAQKINGTGVVQWTPGGVYIATTTTGNGIAAVSDGVGGAIIAWHSLNPLTDANIYAQRIDASGVLLWTTGGVPISTEFLSQANPTIATDGAGGAIITWMDEAEINDWDVYAQRISQSGVIQWAINGVAISTASQSQLHPRIVSDGSGGAIIAWEDSRGGTSSEDIYAQQIDANGIVQWALDGVPVTTAGNRQGEPVMVSDGTGGAVIAWYDYRSGTNYDIYAQRLSNSGTQQWSTNGVAISTASGEQYFPRIASDGSGGAIITWFEQYRTGGNDVDVYAQRINANGVVQWIPNGVPIATGDDVQNDPSILAVENGGAVITWQDNRTFDYTNIYAQKISANGIIQWALDGVAISIADNDQLTPVIASDGVGGAIIAWSDLRNSIDLDIYAQRVYNDGTLGENNTPAGSSIVVQPFDPATGTFPAILTFSTVTLTGQTTLTSDTSGAQPPSGFQVSTPPIYYDFATTANYEGPVQVCINYTSSLFHFEQNIRLFHFESGNWVDITTTLDTALNNVCGSVTAFSPFAIFETSTHGRISGSVQVGGEGLENATVKLLNVNGEPLENFSPVLTDGDGQYDFDQVPSSLEYQILIVEPLGYSVDQNPKVISLTSGGNVLVNFYLTQAVVTNNARGLGYWKHQFDVYVTNRGNAQETQQSLTTYIAGIHEHYTPHFDLFAGITTFEQWQDVITTGNSAPIFEKAICHLAALVLNLSSLKIGQYTLVTFDNRTAGDVLTYVSILLIDNDPTNDQLAKSLAEQVNNHVQITSGIVPIGSVLYKESSVQNEDWTFDMPKTYALYQNYPNPFNPTTVIKFDLPVYTYISLKVYDMLGLVVDILVDETKPAGQYEVMWNPQGLASGVYLYRLEAGTFTQTKKVILLR
jgi:hypothetical protein